MNKLIKIASLALLLCIPTAYSMENNVVVPVNTEPVTLENQILPNEIIQEIFRSACVDKERKIKNEAETIVNLRSVCKHWQNIFNPIASRNMLKWNPKKIACNIFNTNIIEKNKDQLFYIQFLADAITDKPFLYDIIMPTLITGNKLHHAKILFQNGANPNLYAENEMLLKLADYNMEAFRLILQQGGDIYLDSGNGQTIMDIALTQARTGNNGMLNVILQEKAIQPEYQQRVNNYLIEQNRTIPETLIYLISATTAILTTCTLF